LAAATVTLAALAMTGPVQAATIANGFSNGNFSQGTYVNGGAGYDTLFYNSSNATAITDWTVTSGSVDWIGTYWNGPKGAGDYSIDMNGDSPGAIAQTFQTTPGASYTASFSLSGNPDGGTGSVSGTQITKVLTVQATSNSEATYIFPVPADMTEPTLTWDSETYTFMATTDSTTLTFTGDPHAGAYGPVIADVSVAPTTPPESTTVTCTGTCQVQVQSSTTGVGGGVTTNTTDTNYSVTAAFGTGTLNCDYFVSGSRPADPLVVTSSSAVGGTVTLTFPASFFTNGDQDNTPVCFGANKPFLTWLPVRGSSSFAYQGLLFNCGSWIYRYFAKYFPVQACVYGYSWNARAETVVIQTNTFGGGDPMYW
jgi:choice-of-anchor C domain-containing protein